MIIYATFGRRVWAFMFDAILDLIMLGAIWALTNGEQIGWTFGMWYAIHHVGFMTEGGTLGHRLAGLRVVRMDGERLGVVHAIVRHVVLMSISLPPLGFGVLWMLDERDRRGWHDLAAGSVVVREVTPATASGPSWATDPPWLRATAPPQQGLTHPD